MIISDSARLVFVHVQKTGGTTVQAWLQATLPDARTLRDRHRHAGLRAILEAEPDVGAYLVLGCVRNPWARMLSWHRMVRRWVEAVPEGEQLTVVRDFRGNRFAQRVAREHPDFESFVLDGPDRFPRLRRPQVDYLTAGDRTADVVARTETLDADLDRLAGRLGLAPPPAERHNVDVERVDYRGFYTPAMRDRVGEVFARDCAAFGYTF